MTNLHSGQKDFEQLFFQNSHCDAGGGFTKTFSVLLLPPKYPNLVIVPAMGKSSTSFLQTILSQVISVVTYHTL